MIILVYVDDVVILNPDLSGVKCVKRRVEEHIQVDWLGGSKVLLEILFEANGKHYVPVAVALL